MAWSDFLIVRHGRSTNNVLMDAESPEDFQKIRCPDPALTELGEEQAFCTGLRIGTCLVPSEKEKKQLSHIENDPLNQLIRPDVEIALFSSYFSRAILTARGIQRGILRYLPEGSEPPKLVPKGDLGEVGGFYDYNKITDCFEGKPGPCNFDIVRAHPDVHWVPIEEMPQENSAEGWYKAKWPETMKECLERTRRILNWMEAQNEREGQLSRVFILVTHMDMIRLFLQQLVSTQSDARVVEHQIATSEYLEELVSNCSITHLRVTKEDNGSRWSSLFIGDRAHTVGLNE